MVTKILITLSVIFAVISNIPYIIDIVKGKTKPRVVSWIIWAILSTITMFAAIAERQIPTVILLLVITMVDVPIIILGWKKGNKKVENIDIGCLIGGGVGLALWWVFNSPAIAVIASLSIDMIAALPTILHSWKKPGEETLVSFFLGALKALCTILVLTDWRVTASAFPIYLFTINLAIALIIVYRRKYIKTR